MLTGTPFDTLTAQVLAIGGGLDIEEVSFNG
jgi:hypothetical protein